MLLGMDPLTISSLLVLASGKYLQCPDHEPTKINVVPQTEDVKVDADQSLKKIQNYDMDTVDPYQFHGQTITQGFTSANISIEQNIKFGQASMPNYNAACLWYDTITVELKIDPTIVIAKEMYKDSCMRKAILDHELKHVRVDREVVNKFARVMGKKLYNALKERGFEAGPFEVARAQEVADKMQKVVNQILDLESQKLSIVRMERQREVDNLEEYTSVDQQCPNFEKKKNKLYSDLTSR